MAELFADQPNGMDRAGVFRRMDEPAIREALHPAITGEAGQKKLCGGYHRKLYEEGWQMQRTARRVADHSF